jgi:hypothetical protein
MLWCIPDLTRSQPTGSAGRGSLGKIEHDRSATFLWIPDLERTRRMGAPSTSTDDAELRGAGHRARGGRAGSLHSGTPLQGRAGHPSADGALAAHAAVSTKTLHALPDDMSRVESGWVGPAAVALRAVLAAGELSGRLVLVVGGGPIGQLCCRLARHYGAAHVWLSEPSSRTAAAGAGGGEITATGKRFS